MTLTEFLLARIAEDEEVARQGISTQADPENGWGYEGRALTPHVGIIHELQQAEHIMRWHPARVLAECEAKRRIVEEAALWGCSKTMASILALPYAEHPDYREEWRP